MRRADADVATWLHDKNGRKPFTASPLRGFRAERDGALRLRTGDEGWLRITLAGDEYFRLFLSRFMDWGTAARLTIGEADFAVSAVTTTPEGHPWAGYTTPEVLMAGAKRETSIAFELATPTAFSMGNDEVELSPRPDLLFDSLARKWAEWCGSTPLPAALPKREWFWEHARVSDLRLRRECWRFDRYVQLGTAGYVSYRVVNADEAVLHTLNTLADFAFYAGVGRKTTQGMGQVRRTNRQEFLNREAAIRHPQDAYRRDAFGENAKKEKEIFAPPP
jgi:CRISPR-associated endoribonuclease Cas6